MKLWSMIALGNGKLQDAKKVKDDKNRCKERNISELGKIMAGHRNDLQLRTLCILMLYFI